MQISFPALKLLLLISSLFHYYSGVVTRDAPTENICARIASNKLVDFFLIGRKSSNRLLITADYLVYELPSDSLQNDQLNMSGVKPIQLKDYFPELFQTETFQMLIYGKNESEVKIFTTGKNANSKTETYLRMVSIEGKLLFTYNMDSKDTDVNPNIIVPRSVQEFVSASNYRLTNSNFYSFYIDQNFGSIRMKYNLNTRKDMKNTKYECTCKTAAGDMVLRLFRKNCHPYGYWNWMGSFKGWADNLIEMNSTVRFYLFDKRNQQVMIFDQDDAHIVQNDVISIVRYKKYKDFFICPELP